MHEDRRTEQKLSPRWTPSRRQLHDRGDANARFAGAADGRAQPVAPVAAGGSLLASSAAIAVVSGTAAISPIEPTSIATICSATGSRLTASRNGVPAVLKMRST